MKQIFVPLFTRLVEALERLAPPKLHSTVDFSNSDAFTWEAERGELRPIVSTHHMPFHLLIGIDHVAKILFQNTERFAKGLPANNALLWGSRGMGKSSLVKAIHAELNQKTPHSLILIEIHREDISTLPSLLGVLRDASARFILFCDDLSFDADDTSYKSLKAVLDGGIEGKPENVLFYATSNRRHLMPREMLENEQGTAIHPSDSVQEKLSLSDRFGLWLGFHQCSEETYQEIVLTYATHLQLPIDSETLFREANEWSRTRGSRSGRVAWQFILDIAGRLGIQPVIHS